MNQSGNKSASELVSQDFKMYTEGDTNFSVSQLETASLDLMMSRKDDFDAALEIVRDKNHLSFSALLITDITALDSILFIAGDRAVVNAANFPRIEKDIPFLKGVVSRKKQLIPLLTELLRKIG
jgi:manganese-dependent inorganic pyrophosphatase